jgi:alpha-ketoglutarate-dependent taurine dioxygenase
MTLETRDLTPNFGTEVIGFDPAASLDDATRSQLQELFDTRGVLLFRGIDLPHAGQVRLSRMLIRQDGAADGRDEEPLPDDTFYVSNRNPDSAAPFGRLQFHADTMWCDDPYQVLSLYGVEVDQPNAPTIFVSGTDAWKTLPDDLRERIKDLKVLHTAGHVRRGDTTDVLVSDVSNPPSTVTSLAHRHPRTGETVLLACEQMTQEIVGLPHDESEKLLGEVFDHFYRPDAIWAHEWAKGDFLVWDNIAMQHSRKNVQMEGPARVLRKFATPHPDLRPDQRPVFSAADAKP